MDELLATVSRTYRLAEKRLLVLHDDYEGGAEVGDVVSVELPDGRTVNVTVDGVAWGSAFESRNPPLTIIVRWDDEADPVTGARVRGVR